MSNSDNQSSYSPRHCTSVYDLVMSQTVRDNTTPFEYGVPLIPLYTTYIPKKIKIFCCSPLTATTGFFHDVNPSRYNDSKSFFFSSSFELIPPEILCFSFHLQLRHFHFTLIEHSPVPTNVDSPHHLPLTSSSICTYPSNSSNFKAIVSPPRKTSTKINQSISLSGTNDKNKTKSKPTKNTWKEFNRNKKLPAPYDTFSKKQAIEATALASWATKPHQMTNNYSLCNMLIKPTTQAQNYWKQNNFCANKV